MNYFSVTFYLWKTVSSVVYFLACYITRLQNSALELIVQKWAHSLVEVDLAWSTATAPLDAAVFALTEKGPESKLR